MNEQIQNLKDKIWTEEYWTNPNTDKLLPAQLNRFAELIVKECTQSIENTIETNCITDGEKMGCEFAILDLLKHFGVEE